MEVWLQCLEASFDRLELGLEAGLERLRDFARGWVGTSSPGLMFVLWLQEYWTGGAHLSAISLSVAATG